jgi:hypothetical protein
MAIYMWREWPVEATDYAAEVFSAWSTKDNAWYWVSITPNKDCELTKVIFWWAITWTLKITQWDSASASGTTYSISNISEFTLDTPMQLTANTNYTVTVNVNPTWGSSYKTMYNWKDSGGNVIDFPVEWTNITYNWRIYNSSLNTRWYAWNIKWLTTIS